MGYRTLEISTACEIPIKEGQLEITSDAGTILIPIEDLSQIMVHGANIRLSTMDCMCLCGMYIIKKRGKKLIHGTGKKSFQIFWS